jgi:hypothetical protein
MSLLSTIIFIPASAVALLVVIPVIAYHNLREKRQRRAIKPLPPGTPGGRDCLNCSRSYPATTTSSCPGCQGTLAPARSEAS